MSYAPVFAPDAQSQWRALDIQFQEIALDELERLCHAPPDGPEHISDFIIDEGPVRHYVFVHVTVDPGRRVLTVVGVGYCTRPRV
jgi:hypothetical protein